LNSEENRPTGVHLKTSAAFVGRISPKISDNWADGGKDLSRGHIGCDPDGCLNPWAMTMPAAYHTNQATLLPHAVLCSEAVATQR